MVFFTSIASYLFPMEGVYNFKVGMTCSGCSGAVNRILSKAEGVKSFDISLETQKVSVVAPDLTQDQVFEIVKKAGKPVEVL